MNQYTIDPLQIAAAREKSTEQVEFRASLLTWTAVHGNLQLALRHPMNLGASRPYVEQFVNELGALLVARGMLTAEVLAEAQRRERQFQPNTTLSLPKGTKPRD